MADEKLIEKIMLQVDGLLRGNLAEFLENFQELDKEVSEPKMTATLKIRLKRKKGIVYDSAIQWSKGLKRGDASDAEVYDTDTPDMFEGRDPGDLKDEKDFKDKVTNTFQKMADKNNAEISVNIGGKEIPLLIPRKINS